MADVGDFDFELCSCGTGVGVVGTGAPTASDVGDFEFESCCPFITFISPPAGTIDPGATLVFDAHAPNGVSTVIATVVVGGVSTVVFTTSDGFLPGYTGTVDALDDGVRVSVQALFSWPVAPLTLTVQVFDLTGATETDAMTWTVSPTAGDVVDVARSRLIIQYREAPKLNALVDMHASIAQQIVDCAIQIPPLDDPAIAAGVNLDVDAQIVGQNRRLSNGDTATDGELRVLIGARITRNTARIPSAEYLAALVAFFGAKVRLDDHGAMALSYVVMREPTADEVAVLNEDIVARPMGVKVSRSWAPSVYFGYAGDPSPAATASVTTWRDSEMAKTPVTQPDPHDHEFFESGSPGDINDPPATGLLGTGYVGGAIPDARDHNWLFREHDRLKRFYIQRGLPNWNASETYQVGDIVRYSGIFLVCVVAPPVATNPLTNFNLADRYWEAWYGSPFGSDSAATDTSPIYRARNNQSFGGNGFDRLGFRDGLRVQNWEENWRGNEQLTASGILEKTGVRWNTTIVGSGVGITLGDPSVTFHSRSARVQISTGGSDECRNVSEPLSMFDDGVDAVIEGDFFMGSAGVDQQRIAIGLANQGAEVYGATNAFVGGVLYKGNGDANFKAVCGDGSTLGTPVDTGVAVAVSTLYSYRVEWIGSSQAPAGGATRYMNFFLNGNRVAQISTHLPNGGGSTTMSLVFAQKRDTGSSARIITALPLRFSARTY